MDKFYDREPTEAINNVMSGVGLGVDTIHSNKNYKGYELITVVDEYDIGSVYYLSVYNPLTDMLVCFVRDVIRDNVVIRAQMLIDELENVFNGKKGE
jgi:hypothetical protein